MPTYKVTMPVEVMISAEDESMARRVVTKTFSQGMFKKNGARKKPFDVLLPWIEIHEERAVIEKYPRD